MIYDRQNINGGGIMPTNQLSNFATWNIEGYSDSKQIILEHVMLTYGIGVLCIQETHRKANECFITDSGFLVLLSGAVDEISAGVGFIIAPYLRRALHSFDLMSARMAAVKFRVNGGKCAFISAYAPQSAIDYDYRQQFFARLQQFYSSISVNGEIFICGDFNARLRRCFPGEEDIIGDYIFQGIDMDPPLNANRYLLSEFCHCTHNSIANSFFHQDNERLVTYYELSARPLDNIAPNKFAQIDFILCSADYISYIDDIFSNRLLPLSSHHFLLQCRLKTGMKIPRQQMQTQRMRHDYAALRNDDTRYEFLECFHAAYEYDEIAKKDINHTLLNYNDAIHSAVRASIPAVQNKKRRPWISDMTMHLIEERSEYRLQQNVEKEKELSKAIKRQVKIDREQWLADMLEDGNWNAMKLFKKHRKAVKMNTQLRNKDGDILAKEEQAESMADYFERYQWYVRPACLIDRTDMIFEHELDCNIGCISIEEVWEIVHKLKNQKASGSDEIPAEIWKAIIADEMAAQYFVNFFNECWMQGKIPNAWHKANVVSIFKKGSRELLSNYRPISLLQVSYKIFAAIILMRLKKGGAENRIWPTQFGFRSGYGTNDALFMIRRVMEQAKSSKAGSLLILALDWAKAFDSVFPEGLCHALRRFGIPSKICDLIKDIYSNRIFQISHNGYSSKFHKQEFGISQGCPLSPFLFSILMSVILHDSKNSLSASRLIQELLYADDTLLIGDKGEDVQQYMNVIAKEGKKYGLLLNYDKLELLRINNEDKIVDPDNNEIVCKETMKYLGAQLTISAQINAELNTRLGMAKQEFLALEKIWKHANITHSRKVQLYYAYVVSKLLYGLQSAWLTKPQRAKLDGFHFRCLRKIAGIAHSYISRVTNKEVLQRMQCIPLKSTLLKQQLIYFGSIARNYKHPGRSLVFIPDTLQQQKIQNQKRGRPVLSWAKELRKHIDLFTCDVNRDIANAIHWRKVVNDYCNSLAW